MAKKTIRNDGFYRTKDGRFQADFRHRGERVNRIIDDATTKAEAREWVRQRRAEIDRGVLPPSKKKSMTLGEAAAAYWTEHLRFRRGIDKTSFISLFMRLGADAPLTEITTGYVKAYVSKRESDGLKPSTIKRDLDQLKALLNYAREVWEREDVRPVAFKKVTPKQPQRVKFTPSMRQVHTLISEATPRLALAIQFAVLTGFRKFEVYNLQWDQIDLEAGTIVLVGKGDKEVKVPLSMETVSLLSSIPREQSSRVFDQTNFRREWLKAKTSAGLKKLTFHGLRHAFATWLDEMGAPVQHIQHGLRHSDIDTTLIYVDAANRNLSPYLDKLALTFRNAS